MGEGDQVDGGRVQHDFDRHQHNNKIATDQDAEQPRRKQHGTYSHIGGQGNHASRLVSIDLGVFARTIAPTMAPVRNTPMISNCSK
jgi:hypothetical protein